MSSVLRLFVNANIRLSESFDRLTPFPPRSTGVLGAYEPRGFFAWAERIADVSGRKKPYAHVAKLDQADEGHVGLDFDPEELDMAPAGTYSETAVLDICALLGWFDGRFDLIVCRSTLEHVTYAKATINGLASLLTKGGNCYAKLPCRCAVFAQFNLLLPNKAKRKIIHAIFPKEMVTAFRPSMTVVRLPSCVMLRSRRGCSWLPRNGTID